MELILHDPANIKFMPKAKRYEPFVQDSTAMKLFMTCRRKYFYRIVLGRTVKVNKNQLVLDFGTHYHKFRELLELKGYGEALKYVLSVTLPIPQKGSKWEYLTDLRLVRTVDTAYKWWENEKRAGKFEVVAVEQPFNVSIGEGVFIGGRADQIIKWNGKLWGRDFKTTSKDQAAFSKQLDPNDQAIRYIVGESLLHGINVQGIIFEAIYNTKTIGPKMYIELSSRVDYQIKTWEKEQKFNNRQLKVLREEDIWPMDTNNCAWCEYANVCRKTSEEAQYATLIQDFDLKPWDHQNVDQEVIE